MDKIAGFLVLLAMVIGRLMVGGIDQGVTGKKQSDQYNKAQEPFYVIGGAILIDHLVGVEQ